MLSGSELDELVGSFAATHGCGVAIADRAGQLLANAAAAPDAAARAPIEYLGEVVGQVLVDADASRTMLARHVAHIVELLLHHAHARRLAGVVHEAAIASSVAELTIKNKSLESAVARLRAADRVKSNFLATMSHELRTPLTSVIGYSEMLLEGLAGALTTEQRDYVHTILGKADQLLQLITSVLDMSRAEGAGAVVDVAPVAMAEVVDSVVASFAPQASKRGVQLVQAVEPASALGDRRQIRQVVWNLVSNAVKFAADGTAVEIAVRVGPLVPVGSGTRPDLRLGIHVEVRDHGIGIPRDQLAHIFEPFFQIDSSSTRQYGGTGLGLALAKAYVEAHGGRIWVDSTPNHGSTFVASFPAVASDVRGGKGGA
ncbi:MAG: HAMP domain-containing histidine kinase [Myxococcales bacterium]|nr:HAMP domain-containing histidine kinase [Myxococcales bacterium]